MPKNLPTLMNLEPGTYSWCSCGKSAKEPLCDGSHTDTGREPVEFVITEAKKALVCTCQRTGKPPFCDGTHAR